MTKQVKISRSNAHNNRLSSPSAILEAVLIRRMTGYGTLRASASSFSLGRSRFERHASVGPFQSGRTGSS
jgi:hypothetical protein